MLLELVTAIPQASQLQTLLELKKKEKKRKEEKRREEKSREEKRREEKRRGKGPEAFSLGHIELEVTEVSE